MDPSKFINACDYIKYSIVGVNYKLILKNIDSVINVYEHKDKEAERLEKVVCNIDSYALYNNIILSVFYDDISKIIKEYATDN